MTEYAGPRPPRGWLYGFLLAIFTFWFSSVIWGAFRAHELSAVHLAGDVMILVAVGLIAFQALTNDDYKTSKVNLVARRLLIPLGIILILLGTHF
jgi:hypothetical protein